MKRFAYISPVTFFLSLFIVLVCFVFYYFYKISNDVQNYNVNHNTIIAIILLNKEIDNSTSSFEQLKNYNMLNDNLEKFHELLKKLEANILLHYPDRKLRDSLQDIDGLFAAKVEDVEYFKSFNAALISGSSFLYDLQSNIADTDDIEYKTKNLVSEIMFYLFQFNTNKQIGRDFIENKIEDLRKVVGIEDSMLLENFYKQSKVFLATMASLKRLSEEIQNNKVSKQLNLLHRTLSKAYKNDLYQEKVIGIYLFLSMVIVWIIFIAMYIRSRKNQKILQQHASVFANTQEAIVITDPRGYVVSINGAFSNIYGYKFDEVKGKTLSFLHSGMHDKLAYRDMWHQIIHKGIYQGRIVNKTKDGKNIPVWATIKGVYNQSGELINYIGVQTDLRPLEASQSKAEYLAYHDTLTGLYNRVCFEELLEHSVLSAQKEKTNFAILFIDLDRFKIINDTLGHDIGDKVLIQAALRLKAILGKSNVISRWGGDEFVIILHNVASESFVATLTRKIVEEMKEPIHIDRRSLSITTSIGIAMYPQDAKDAQTLIKYADSAMYQAKENGKNNFYFYTPILSKEIEERLQIDLKLQNALEKNEINIVFQPQYSLKDNKIVSAEALVRWENDELGFISPDKFIPIAEENGFIVPLGYFIFEEACKQYKKMKDSKVALERIAINISTVQLKQKDLADEFLSILSRYGLQTSEIEIEITERLFIENTQKNIKTLQKFREYGFSISIDDFGTGYSSLSYLKRLPIDTLKVDKSFVDDIGLGKGLDDAIVDAIVALAKTMRYTIVAEGIETKVQKEFLKNCGCDIGQGYLFSQPLKSEEIIRITAHNAQ